jgi:mRNA-degrading endonuclease toxin of MazEF toxin-antitoxin module
MVVRQGEIYWATITPAETVGSEQFKRRPFVIVSRDAINRLGQNVVAVPLSSRVHKASQHRIFLPVAEMIKDATCQDSLVDSVALTDQIRVLDISRLESPKIGRLSQTATVALELGLAFLFDIR